MVPWKKSGLQGKASPACTPVTGQRVRGQVDGAGPGAAVWLLCPCVPLWTGCLTPLGSVCPQPRLCSLRHGSLADTGVHMSVAPRAGPPAGPVGS